MSETSHEIKLLDLELGSLNTENFTTDEGSPKGGYAHGIGYTIVWIDCSEKSLNWTPVAEIVGDKNLLHTPNGALIEDVLEACLMRLQHLADCTSKDIPFAEARNKIEEAIALLEKKDV